jgi:hypothetical protein
MAYDAYEASEPVHAKLRQSIKRRASIQENIGVALGAAVFLVLMVIADRAGLPRKWRMAIYGTVVPYWTTVTFSKSHWRRWAFWLSVTFCLVIHISATYIAFEYIFVTIYPGTLVWTPVVFVWTFVVFVAVVRMEERLAGKKDRNIPP